MRTFASIDGNVSINCAKRLHRGAQALENTLCALWQYYWSIRKQIQAY